MEPSATWPTECRHAFLQALDEACSHVFIGTISLGVPMSAAAAVAGVVDVALVAAPAVAASDY